ncbi:MAG: putative membrane-bound dehydrogenase-like protein [Verrucomicrobiales bacterium]|jgi:putative membrane-bound dehydrogenase-like protein
MFIRPKTVLNAWKLAQLAILGAACGACFTHSASALEFEKGDRIAVVGNTLADRLQVHGWMEALLQQKNAGKDLVFRNLGFPGDTVTKRPRSSGFTSPEDYLKHVKADVIFVLFGYNESFAGESGVAGFKKDLETMIDNYRALQPNGESAPRFVLFTPIAHEDLETPNLPDGSANNARLALYATAIKEVAEAKKTDFVELFESTKKLYATIEAPQTINGIHLSEQGNRHLAEIIASQLTGQNVSAAPESEPVRAAVLEKNWHWYNRYRATDGNDVWGGRSSLKFTDDQTNFEVLQHELVMLDIMTDNRDPLIWAAIKGEDYKVDDSNVPAPVPVKSNVGGGSRSSSEEKEGSLKYVSGQDGIKNMTMAEGMEVNLFADEKMFPELVNPVQLNVDPKGRLWVAAWMTYPKWEPLKEMNDRLLILPDENRDGIADKVITFAKVHNPLGFEFWNGGVLVASQPDIIFLKDTDGDDVADVREVYLQGLGSADTHHAANNLLFGPDGGLYWQSGIFLHNNIEHPWGPSLSTGASAMYRFDPRRYTIAMHAGNSPNPHGISFDSWGYLYANDGTGGRAYQVRPEGNGFRMHQLLEKEVRPVPANQVVSSENFPDEMQQDFLICNTIGFLGIKQYKLDRDGGVEQTRTVGKGENRKTVTTTTKPGEVWGEPKGDLIVSSDKNFRPTDAQFGSDGALYIADWHNVIIGHMQHNVRDPNRDHQHGRIYRMIAKDRPLQKPVEIAGAPIPKLLEALEHEIDGVRQRARVELSARETSAVIAACNEWMKKFDPKKEEDAHHLLEALWLHQQHNVRNTKLLTALLGSPAMHARIAANTVQHHWYAADPATSSPAAVAEEKEEIAKKSGITSDTPELTEVYIGTIVEKLQFALKEFSVKAGKKISITFANPDFMPHNFVIVQPGAADEVGIAAMQLGAKGFDLQWVPESDKIIVSSKLIDHRGEQVLDFTAPETPGDYPFVCTFPGHHILMRGIMKVTK